MGLFSRFESKAENVIEGGSGASANGGIEPVKLAKRACKEMEREKMVGVGHEYAPTLYNILLSTADDVAMNGYYPSLAGEIETYLTSRASQSGLVFDCPPLVRFIVDEGLKHGKFDIIAESVSPAIIAELRHEEMVRYGLEMADPVQDDYAWEEPAREQPRPHEHAAQPAGYAPQPAYGGQAPSGNQAQWQPEPGPEDIALEYPDFAQRDAHAAAAGAAVGAAAESAAAAARSYPPTDPPHAAAPTASSVDRTVMIDSVQPARPQAHLVNRTTGEVHSIAAERTVIGRESGCDVVILDPSVSRRHAELLHSDAGWLVRDTGSTNGTKINGVATTQSRIYSGDVLDLGKTQLEFREG